MRKKTGLTSDNSEQFSERPNVVEMNRQKK